MRATTLRRVGIGLLVGAGTAALAAQQAPPPPLVTAAGDSRRPAGRRLALADLRRQLHQPAAQPAHADYARQRQPARPAVDVPDGHARQFRNDLAPARQRPVRDGTAERRVGARRADGPPDLALPPRAAGHRPDRVLRPGQPRVRRARRQAVHDDARRASAGARHEDRRHRRGTRRSRTTRSATPRRSRRWSSKDKVIVGVAGGEFGIRGFIDAYDAQTGKRAWRFYTIPGPASRATTPGRAIRGRSAARASGSPARTIRSRISSSTEPATRAPTTTARAARATTFYSTSLVALDADTGKIRWHYQFTPHDVHDWDATEVPVLADITIAGQPRKVVMFANRNGFYYTLDRTNGKGDRGEAVRPDQLGEGGRRQRPADPLPGHEPDEKGALTCPDITGGTNFWPPTYDPSTQTFFVNAREVCATFYAWKPEFTPGDRFTGGAAQRASTVDFPAYGALRAIDPATGARKWEFRYLNPSTAGLLTTASGPDLQRRRRGQPAGARLAQRQAAVALSDGRPDARNVADHLHARWTSARARARGHDADRLGVTELARRRSGFGSAKTKCCSEEPSGCS